MKFILRKIIPLIFLSAVIIYAFKGGQNRPFYVSETEHKDGNISATYRFPGNDNQALYQQGISRVNSDDYSGAETIYRRIIEISPSDPQAYYALGGVLLYQKRYVEAKSAYQKSIDLDEKFAMAYGGVGQAELALGRAYSAVEYGSKSIELDPNILDQYCYRGFAYETIGNTKAAIEDFRKCSTLNPNSLFSKKAMERINKLSGIDSNTSNKSSHSPH
jgi:tetratricopeptide (TPR) repeat protein